MERPGRMILGAIPWGLLGIVLISAGSGAESGAVEVIGLVVVVVAAFALLAGLIGYAVNREE